MADSVPDILQQGGLTVDIARHYGKVVIEGARRAGVSNSSIESMKARMLRWTELVVTHEEDIQRVIKSDLPKKERLKLANQIRASLGEMRVEMFGE